jgi:CPA2 family monovalent cation:H+ antiporter-2
MHHGPDLIATIVVGLGLAFVLGTLAHRLRISPLIGYLLAGVAVGPFTPGFVADQGLSLRLAELGLILLMFGVGLHFSLKDLLSVGKIAVPGAVAQIAIATLLGMGLSWALGWDIGAGIVFGLALSVASTIVLLRALHERHELETERGRIAVGWLIVEDLAMVLILVLLPAVAPLLVAGENASAPSLEEIAFVMGITIGKVAIFVAVMMLVGRRLLPWILHYIAHTGSRELFRLAVLALALVVAFVASELFGVSFALGAFFAGMVLSESPLSQRAAEESLPLRDAFAVLFFVSVGMLFDFSILFTDFLAALGTVFVIVIGKSITAFLIVRAFGHSTSTALMISASLAQIGEFSFILAALGVTLGLLPEEGRTLILAGAMLSIVLNHVAFRAGDLLKPFLSRKKPLRRPPPRARPNPPVCRWPSPPSRPCRR